MEKGLRLKGQMNKILALVLSEVGELLDNEDIDTYSVTVLKNSFTVHIHFMGKCSGVSVYNHRLDETGFSLYRDTILKELSDTYEQLKNK